MGIGEVTQRRVQITREVSGHVGAIAFLTMMGGAITAIVGHARRMPNVVEIGRKIALGGGLGLLGSMVTGFAVSKAIQVNDAKEVCWALRRK